MISICLAAMTRTCCVALAAEVTDEVIWVGSTVLVHDKNLRSRGMSRDGVVLVPSSIVDGRHDQVSAQQD